MPGNVVRALPPTANAEIDTASWVVPHEFAMLSEHGGIARDEMFRAFNMGVGMVVIADAEAVPAVVDSARSAGVAAWLLGRIVRGNGELQLI